MERYIQIENEDPRGKLRGIVTLKTFNKVLY